MTSKKQVEANRRNSLKSTGPKTSEGKKVVRRNALKHGLLSREVFLPDEDGNALEELGKRLRSHLVPFGELEDLLVDRIVSAAWRLRRVGWVEAGIFAWEYYGDRAEQATKEAESYTETKQLISFPIGEETVITDEKKHEVALSKAREAEAAQRTGPGIQGLAFCRGGDAFSKLSRYETGIERSLYKALHELQLLQAARSGA